jgi:hypothetical protein
MCNSPCLFCSQSPVTCNHYDLNCRWQYIHSAVQDEDLQPIPSISTAPTAEAAGNILAKSHCPEMSCPMPAQPARIAGSNSMCHAEQYWYGYTTAPIQQALLLRKDGVQQLEEQMTLLCTCPAQYDCILARSVHWHCHCSVICVL